MGREELGDMAKQQFILGVRNNLMRKRLIVHSPKNLYEVIKYKLLLELANRTDRGAASHYVKKVFAAFPNIYATQITIRATNRAYGSFNQQANNRL